MREGRERRDLAVVVRRTKGRGGRSGDSNGENDDGELHIELRVRALWTLTVLYGAISGQLQRTYMSQHTHRQYELKGLR